MPNTVRPQPNQPPRMPAPDERASTGVAGLDEILGGGLPRHSTYLLEGAPGSGKTTLGMQFVLNGHQAGERVLFLSTLESENDLRLLAASHGWTLDGVALRFHSLDDLQDDLGDQSVFHPAEVELPRLIETLLNVVDEEKPDRLVIDSLTELRLLALDPRWYRRQILTLKRFFADRRCTVVLIDEPERADNSLQSLVRGVVTLEQIAPIYGPARRHVEVRKVRGIPFRSGRHDMQIRTGGLEVYPRLVAAEHRRGGDHRSPRTTGLAELDAMSGGGLDPDASILFLGPSGAGKSLLAGQIVASHAQQDIPASMYVFDERIQTLLGRSRGVGLPLEPHLDGGLVRMQQVDPAELTPGEFSQRVREDCEQRQTQLVVIDSLNGYAHAMPEERLLAVHLHELLSFLNQQGVTVIMVMTRHGLGSSASSAAFDVSYVSDTVFLFQLFEHRGAMRKAISIYKRRGGRHEATIRELGIGPDGVRIGQPLREFEHILSGHPVYTGASLDDAIRPEHDDHHDAR